MLPILLTACDATEAADSAPPGGADTDTSGPDSATDSAIDSGDSSDTAQDTGTFDPPDDCPVTTTGRQDITSAAGTYFMGHPTPDVLGSPTVILLPGGNGIGPDGSGGNIWYAFRGDDIIASGYRLVTPYVTEEGYPNTNVPDVAAILDEVLACWGGDPAKVHLVGHSNGGYLAYNVVGPELGERFVTITGAPAYFVRLEKQQLAGIAFHNAAGEDDPEWLEAMTEADQELRDNGFESILSVWANTGHTPGAEWDGLAGMIAFWDAHPTRD